MKKVIACLLLWTIACSISLGSAQAAIYPEIPTAKKVDQSDEKVVVIVTASGEVDDVLKQVTTTFPSSEVRKTFKRALNGFSIEVLESEVKMLQELNDVERVDKVVEYKANLDGSVPFVGTDNIRGKLDPKGEHLTGKGIKVAVIDTGIDYSHPDLKQNYKGGYDVVDYDHDPMETVASQGPPTLHGTHVAGIIAANGQVKGVAPQADIYAYRALGPGGQGTTEQVIEAIEKAIDDDVDVLNLSLGNTVNGPDWPTSVALDKAVEEGIVAVTSNGNSGPNMWTVGSPGTSTKAISVGASAPPIKTPFVTIPGLDKEIALSPIGGTLPWTLKRDFEIVDAGHGLEEEWQDIDANGKIALIKRGMIPFSEKAKHAQENGAKAVLIYNNLPGAFVGAVEQGIKLPVVSISKEDGDWLIEQLEESKERPYARTIYRNQEDFIAPFSSRGPVTQSWEVKPDLVAPGVSIDSTVPKGYLGLNGTSMSAPHVAGAAALVKQAHPDWTPEQIKAALMNTAKKLLNEDGEPYYPYEQGAGRLQVDKAIDATTLAYPGAITFGKWTKEDPREKREVTFTIENHDKKTRTFHVKPPFELPDGLQWEVPFATKIKPGEKKEVSLKLDMFPAVLAEGIHHGDIVIEGGKDPISIPYVFFIEEPNYPRAMAFNFGHGDRPGEYRYELYLPGGAEEMGIALYDPDTFQFVKFLDFKENIGRGMVGKEWDNLDLPDGNYKALIFAKKDGKEDTIESTITIGASLPEEKQGEN
ncbi:S8 family serine peptidase [Halalkalibacter okhensis]|uniref:Peptidase S8 n=1 Tax=Halalkalibacter okhensis TaxID=333138 RepID=A0A0B0IBZ5_9BACI|nr:S8 family serine peptidase [Halalkalibacter okhensis]KHF38347.1 peptidase S8 [Halalkalibacter okhensis]